LSIVQELMKRGALNEAGIKILVTGGTSPDQLLPGDQPRLILFATEHIPPPAERFTQGISVVTTPLARSLPTSKTTHYAPGIIALQKNAGALEALYVNGRGEILEGATSNFFAIKGGTLYTCHSEEILLGITREVVLHLAPLPLKLQPVTQGDSLDEAFITASNKEVMPVVQIDGKPVGNGAVGPHTQRLMQTFRAYTQEPTWAPLSIPRHFH
jgi:branched-chain amino acid aminotransferase